MMVWEYFTQFYKSALCYTDVHVYRATSLPATQAFDWSIDQVQIQACIHPSIVWQGFWEMCAKAACSLLQPVFV